jgi:nitrite reductase (NADH) large subunit
MKYIIIGNGVAGTEAALAIRKTDAEGDITLISESTRLFYYRPKLIDYLAGETTVEKFTLFKEDHYAKNRITNVLGTKIVSVDAAGKRVMDAAGKTYAYDRLLLATGADPVKPPIGGANLEGVFTLRSVDDADRIMEFCSGADDLVVVGGGLLGLETANGLRRFAKNITVVEFFEWLLPRQLDRQGGAILQAMLGKKGLSFALGDSVSEIRGSGRVESVLLKSGKEIKARAVIISAGIRGRSELAVSAGAAVNKGIVVDDRMMTSVPGIYAAGDPVEHQGCLYGIWPAAREQGRIAGLNMAGNETAYSRTLMASILKITGIDLYSAGDFNKDDVESYTCAVGDSYKKFLQKDSPVGAIILGDPEAIKIAQKVMEGKIDPSELKNMIQRSLI